MRADSRAKARRQFPLMVYLLLQNEVLENVPFDLTRELVLVGRGADAHIKVDHPSVSRIHARIERTSDALLVEDLGSRNGTFVNDRAVACPTAVHPGDRIRCGEVVFVVRERDAAPGVSAAAPALTRRTLVGAAVVILACCAAAAFAFTRTRHEEDRSPAPVATAPAEPVTNARPSNHAAMQELPVVVEPQPEPHSRPVIVEAPPVPKPQPPTEVVESPPAPTAAATLTPMETAAPKPAPATEAPFPDRLAEARAAGFEAVSALLADCDRRALHDEADRTLAVALEMRPEDATLRARIGDRRYLGRWRSHADLVKLGVLDDAGKLRGSDTDRARVRRLYIDLVGRTPLLTELPTALAMSREEMVDKLLASAEHASLWYEDELFYFLLLDDFRPSEDRLNDLPGRLAAAQVTVKDGIGEIVKSQFFNARNPGNDTYVTVILEQLLGITVQKDPRLLESGKKMYDGYATSIFGKRGASQGDFVEISMQQPAFSSFYVARAGRRLLGQDLPKKELDRLAAQFHGEPRTFLAIEREIVLSAAYTETCKTPRKKTDQQFVRTLYHDLLARAPTYQELRNMRNATQALADPVGIRSVIIKAILESESVAPPPKNEIKPATWIPDQFLHMLGRSPSPAELETFLDVWKTPACRPSTILHAILTSAEYQHY